MGKGDGDPIGVQGHGLLYISWSRYQSHKVKASSENVSSFEYDSASVRMLCAIF
jgi:hypothetical protein